MTNADKFKTVFGIYSEEFWAKPESDMLNWINSEYQEPKIKADAQPVKHGRWISIGHKLSRICSVCDYDEPYKFADDDANVYNYCPNCGAKMDGEKNG